MRVNAPLIWCEQSHPTDSKYKQKVDKYANIVNTQYGDFIAEFTVFNRNDVGTVKIYDLESYQKDRFSQPRQRADKTGMSLTEPTISITDLVNFVKFVGCVLTHH
ncbi:MAG: hypothetical protein K6A44_01910 [bacterium]|nr:hypothetical protein [bacterium]